MNTPIDFDPHVALVILLVFVALVIVIAVAFIPIEPEGPKNRKE